MQIGKARLDQGGFALLGILLVIVLAGLVLAEAANSWSNMRQREREQELLRVGSKIREAIGNYYQRSPGLVKQYPSSLEELVKDNRFPKPERHLRKLYADPLTGQASWGTLEAPSGGIMGVYSLAQGKPFKQRNFPPIYQSFEKKTSYAEWIFAYLPDTDALLSTP